MTKQAEDQVGIFDNYGFVDPKLYTHWAYLPDANDGEFESKKGRSIADQLLHLSGRSE